MKITDNWPFFSRFLLQFSYCYVCYVIDDLTHVLLIVYFSGTWSIWPRNTWRNTMCGIGCEWLHQTRIATFMNCGTSTLLRTRVRRKNKCHLFPGFYYHCSMFCGIRSFFLSSFGGLVSRTPYSLSLSSCDVIFLDVPKIFSSKISISYHYNLIQLDLTYKCGDVGLLIPDQLFCSHQTCVLLI